MSPASTHDVAVIGAGVFGSWTAHFLNRAGKKVVLLDAYGPANSRASSGGESRIIRAGYGADEIYSRWAMRSLDAWKGFFARAGKPLFHPTGMLWLAREDDSFVRSTQETLARLGARFEPLDRSEIAKRFPQFALDDVAGGLFEPESGALMARCAVQAVVEDAARNGVAYETARVSAPTGRGRVTAVATESGVAIRAETFVFACGPWLGKVFPHLLGERIFPSRQEVFFFGTPAGAAQFTSPAMPTWIFHADEIYGFPDLESRGVKVAFDHHGPAFDPDTGVRVASAEGTEAIRRYVARRFPALAGAPIVETRVCQYENTSSGDFLIDRHPEFENVWLVGGGSGNGFKHGPALGEYVAGRVLGAACPAWAGASEEVERRFSLATKQRVQKRAVF
jgi:sarcosine oxidase